MKITKELEGKRVYLIPTGNNARYFKGDFLLAEVIKVARINITIKIDNGREQILKFKKDSNWITEWHNSGFSVYETKQELNDAKEKQTLRTNIMKICRDFYSLDLLSLEDLRKINEIMKTK